MPEDELDLLAGADDPRPLPEGFADHLADALTEPLLVGLGDPRPLPEHLRSSLLVALEGGARRRWAHRRVAAVAAVLLLVATGLAFAATGGEQATERASAPAPSSSTPSTRPRPSTTTSTPTTAAPLPAAPAEGDAPPPAALSESDPAYARLAHFESAAELVEWTTTPAIAAANPTGFSWSWTNPPSGRAQQALPAHPVVPVEGRPVASQPLGGTLSRDHTNVQEAGVDEPDLLEVGEGALYVLTDTAVHAVRIDGGGAATAGSAAIADPAANEVTLGMMRDGDRLLVLVGVWGQEPRTMVKAVDVSLPAEPVYLDTTVLDGSFVDARLVAGRLHVVTSWTPGPFPFSYEGAPATPDAASAVLHNQAVLAGTTVADWVPPSLDWQQVQHPPDFAGFSVTIVSSVDTHQLADHDVAAVLADPHTVYATADTLVVTTERWEYSQQATWNGSSTVRTNLHRFTLTADGPRYEASGSVPGYIASGFALDEDAAGNLRVAATQRPPWAAPGEPGLAAVTVLQQQDGALVPIGVVDGLGEAGEQIQGVRFVGDLGFVVTFRQTDPLYVIDLSRPDRPRVRGALSVTGFSSYLHEPSGGSLLGVGVEADAAGRVVGGALSIYDVSDPDNPALAHRATIPERFLGAVDPHAVTVARDSVHVVLPLSPAWSADWAPPTAGFEVYAASALGIERLGRIDHGAQFEEPVIDHAYRAAIVGGVLYTVSGGGVLASDLLTLAPVGWAPLPLGAPQEWWMPTATP